MHVARLRKPAFPLPTSAARLREKFSAFALPALFLALLASHSRCSPHSRLSLAQVHSRARIPARHPSQPRTSLPLPICASRWPVAHSRDQPTPQPNLAAPSRKTPSHARATSRALHPVRLCPSSPANGFLRARVLPTPPLARASHPKLSTFSLRSPPLPNPKSISSASVRPSQPSATLSPNPRTTLPTPNFTLHPKSNFNSNLNPKSNSPNFLPYPIRNSTVTKAKNFQSSKSIAKAPTKQMQISDPPIAKKKKKKKKPSGVLEVSQSLSGAIVGSSSESEYRIVVEEAAARRQQELQEDPAN